MKLLPKLFIKNYNDIDNPKVRTAYGTMCSIIGIISNLIICLSKIIIGLLIGAISIVADGINNMADAGSSIITLIGFKLSNKAPNRDHPFGYERIEYITGLLVSIFIVIIGVLLLRSSIDKLLVGEVITYEPKIAIVTIIILALAIILKCLQSLFNRKYGRLINSTTLLATSIDSLNDCISTGAVLIALLVSLFYPNSYVDGIMGIFVSLFIMYSGLKLVATTISPLIGESPDKEFMTKIIDRLNSYPNVLGYHDLVIHSYGPKKIFITAHVEVDSKVSINESHDMIDNIERDFLKDNINLVIHMDPVDITDENVIYLKNEITNILNEIDVKLKFHDFRVVHGDTHTNMIFDVVKEHDCKLADEVIKYYIDEKIKNIKYDNELFAVVTFDMDYTGGE